MAVSQAGILTDIKSIFSLQKIIPNRAMNIMGCQAARMLLARALLWKRRRPWLKDLTDIERTLLRDGVVLIEDFFDAETFEQVLMEAERCEIALVERPAQVDKFGLVHKALKIKEKIEYFASVKQQLLNNELLLRCVRLQEGWKPKDNFFNIKTALVYERLEQVEDPAPVPLHKDKEISSADLHADTFHFVTKAFITLNDMTTENSPYSYCYGSHVLNRERLMWEYKNSIKSDQYHGDYYNRVYPDDMVAMKLKLTPIVAKKNTLIITDTFGFHLRGQMTSKGQVRRMLRMDFRSNPFRI